MLSGVHNFLQLRPLRILIGLFDRRRFAESTACPHRSHDFDETDASCAILELHEVVLIAEDAPIGLSSAGDVTSVS